MNFERLMFDPPNQRYLAFSATLGGTNFLKKKLSLSDTLVYLCEQDFHCISLFVVLSIFIFSPQRFKNSHEY